MQRLALNVLHADGIEQDIDATGLPGHGICVLLDGLLVQSIHLSRLRYPTSGADLFGHLLEGGEGSTGEEDVCPLAGEGAGHRTADRAPSPVDHGSLVLEQHLDLLRSSGWTGPPGQDAEASIPSMLRMPSSQPPTSPKSSWNVTRHSATCSARSSVHRASTPGSGRWCAATASGSIIVARSHSTGPRQASSKSIHTRPPSRVASRLPGCASPCSG